MDTKTAPVKSLPSSLLDLGKPSLHALSYALRHPDVWPAGFVLDYSDCDQCAMGLAHELWRHSIPEPHREINVGASRMAHAFAIPYLEANRIFFAAGEWAPSYSVTEGYLWWKKTQRFADFEAVTPEMVADQIDQYLATVE